LQRLEERREERTDATASEKKIKEEKR